MQRNAGLDAIRLLAFFLVMGRHLHLPANEENWFLKAFQNGGWVGIDLFFVLSGFLVSGILFRELQSNGSVHLGKFLLRRAVKIYPAFYVLLLVYLGMASLSHIPISTEKILGEVFFLQNYLGNICGHTWSLAVEEHFYLGLALIFWIWLSRKGNSSETPRFIVPLFFLIAIIAMVSRIYASEPSYASHCRMDALFFGVLLAYLVQYHNLLGKLQKYPAWLLIGVGALVLLPCFILAPGRMVIIGFSTNYIGAGLMLLGAIRMPPCRLLSALAAATYSMYLWHMMANTGALFLFPVSGSYALYLLAYLTLAIGLGYLMYILVERPASRLFRPRHKILSYQRPA